MFCTMKKRRSGAGCTCLAAAVVVVSAVCLLRYDSSSSRRRCAIVVVAAKPEWTVQQQQQQRHQRRSRSHLPDDDDDDNNDSTDADAVDAILSLVRQSQARFFLASSSSESSFRRPFVTLAFAMSLDGKIAVQQQPVNNHPERHDDEDAGPTEPLRPTTSSSSSSSNLPISGSSSRHFTHGLRSLHDGIMIGRGTAVSDAPRLSNRLYHHTNIHQPRPIILDPRGHCRTYTAMLRNFVKRPILVMAAATTTAKSSLTMAKISGDYDEDDDESKESGIPLYDVLHIAEQERLKSRQNNEHDDDGEKGGSGCPSDVTANSDGFSRVNNEEKEENDDDDNNNNDRSLLLDLRATLQSLRGTYGIKSVMVEGGADTLHSFFFSSSQRQQQRRRSDDLVLYDCLCLTVNPTMVLGQRRGISPFREAMSLSSFFDLAGVDHDVNGDDHDDDDDDMVLIDVTRLGNDLQLTYIRRRWC